jgi:hypothetical protein
MSNIKSIRKLMVKRGENDNRAMNMAVVIPPDSQPREVSMGSEFNVEELIGCRKAGAAIPAYMMLFSDASYEKFREDNGIHLKFHPEMTLLMNDSYFREETKINKAASDIYSACRIFPWPVLGTAIIAHCDLKRLKVMIDFLPRCMEIAQIKAEYKEVILSDDSTMYEIYLDSDVQKRLRDENRHYVDAQLDEFERRFGVRPLRIPFPIRTERKITT